MAAGVALKLVIAFLRLRGPGVAAGICLLAFACAPTHRSPDRVVPFQVVSGGLFALSVPDLAESTAWYVEKLGLRSTLSIPASAEGPGVAVLEGGGILVELQQHAGAVGGDTAPEARHGIFKVGIVVADIDETLAALRSRGVEVYLGPYPARDDQPANFIVRDNAGTLIQFIGAGGAR